MSSRITDALRAWIGREVTYVAPEPIGAASIRYFALAIGDDSPLHRDEAFAACTAHAGVIAPPTMVCETNQLYARAPDRNGYIGHTWALPIEDRGFVRGGNEYEFLQPVRPDDRVTVTWRLVELFERPSARGEPLLFVVSEARYTNQRGELLAVNRETNIHA